MNDYNPGNERLRYSDSDLTALYGLDDQEASCTIETPSRSADAHRDDDARGKKPGMPGKTEAGYGKTAEVSAYKVKKGDTLSSIARRSDCSVDELRTLNGIKSGDTIYKGMALKVPVPEKAVPTVTQKAKTKPAIKAVSALTPKFNWPLPAVMKVAREEINGVKPIGIEITGKSGHAVLSAAHGVVKKVGDMRGFGTYVIISHGERYVTVYARLKSVSVKEGDAVQSGSPIALTEGGGNIHFEIGHGGKPVDPLAYLPKK